MFNENRFLSQEEQAENHKLHTARMRALAVRIVEYVNAHPEKTCGEISVAINHPNLSDIAEAITNHTFERADTPNKLFLKE